MHRHHPPRPPPGPWQLRWRPCGAGAGRAWTRAAAAAAAGRTGAGRKAPRGAARWRVRRQLQGARQREQGRDLLPAWAPRRPGQQGRPPVCVRRERERERERKRKRERGACERWEGVGGRGGEAAPACLPAAAAVFVSKRARDATSPALPRVSALRCLGPALPPPHHTPSNPRQPHPHAGPGRPGAPPTPILTWTLPGEGCCGERPFDAAGARSTGRAPDSGGGPGAAPAPPAGAGASPSSARGRTRAGGGGEGRSGGASPAAPCCGAGAPLCSPPPPTAGAVAGEAGGMALGDVARVCLGARAAVVVFCRSAHAPAFCLPFWNLECDSRSKKEGRGRERSSLLIFALSLFRAHTHAATQTHAQGGGRGRHPHAHRDHHGRRAHASPS